MKGMLYTEINPELIDRYIEDDEWVMEQKLDGTRVIAMVTQSGAKFLQRGGHLLKHTAATQHLDAILPELTGLAREMGISAMTLDGELLTGPGTYHLFDVVHVINEHSGKEAVTPPMAQYLRRTMLDIFAKYLPGPRVNVVRQATTWREKQEMWEAANRAGIEGVMLKRYNAPYQPGERVNHGLKVKLVKSADVIVTGVNRGRTAEGRETGNITFGVYVECHDTVYHNPGATESCPACHNSYQGVLTPIGRCSVIGKPHVEPGDVIEVAYLYWTGETTYQPRMVRVREDKNPEDCVMSQFPTYSRELV